MKYLVWTEKHIEGLEEMGIVRLYTEVDDEGEVHREIGIDADGRICHRSPVPGNIYGLFDNVTIEAHGELDISHQAFEELWRRDRE